MYRHQLRFVLRFGVRGEFDQLCARLVEAESARGWAPPRVWHSVNGRVNEVVIEHDHASAETYRSERAELHREAGEVGPLLARLAELVVPGTAYETELDEIEPVPGTVPEV